MTDPRPAIERTAKVERRGAPMLAAPPPSPDPDVAPEFDPRLALERQEVAATVVRFRVAAAIALGPWVGGLAVDWLVEGTERPWVFLVLRLAGAAVIAACYLWLRFMKHPTRRQLFAIDLFAFTSISVIVAFMCLDGRGIESTYVSVIMLVLVCHVLTMTQHWKRNVVLLGVPALAAAGTLLGAALFSPRIADQLRDPRARATFIEYQYEILCTYAILLAGGHILWTLRRQVLAMASVGRYRLKRRIGRGSMGEVWAARDATLERDVALKLLRPELATNRGAVARFEREVSAVAHLAHPNTIRVFDYGATEDGLWFYAMEVLEGRDLSALVQAEGPLAPARAARIVRQAARALAEAHRRGIVHRDVKPGNIFLATMGGEPDVVKVLDFGIARIGAGGAKLRPDEEVYLAGTPAYLAPEVIEGAPADARSDIYSLGAVLYFLLAGRHPFEAEAPEAVLREHVEKPVVPPSVKRGEPLPAALEAVVLRCLEKRPEARFSSAEELAAALDAALEQTG